jgi:hypothetical protein
VSLRRSALDATTERPARASASGGSAAVSPRSPPRRLVETRRGRILSLMTIVSRRKATQGARASMDEERPQ